MRAHAHHRKSFFPAHQKRIDDFIAQLWQIKPEYLLSCMDH